MIELGVPFTDPMADGPTIQKANERALKAGVHLGKIFTLVKKVRQNTDIPILLMGYYNPVLAYGMDRYARDCARHGVDGTLIVDLPVEEATLLKRALKKYLVDLIYLLTPASNWARIKRINQHGSGFIYYVSLTGITGAHHLRPADVKAHLNKIRRLTRLPINVGFGISTPGHVRAIAPVADGVVVGSAIVKLIEKYGKEKTLHEKVGRYVKSLVRAL